MAGGGNDLFASNSLVRNCSFGENDGPDEQPGFTFGVPDTTPPVAGNWMVRPEGTSITAELTEGCTPANGVLGFTLSGTAATVSSWSINGLTLTLNLAGGDREGTEVSLSHADSGIRDLVGNLLANLNEIEVRNTSRATGSLLRIPLLFSGGPTRIALPARPANELLGADELQVTDRA